MARVTPRRPALLAALLVVGLWISASAQSITAPGNAELACARMATADAGPLTLDYYAAAEGAKITVWAAVGSGASVDGARLSIKGGDIVSYAAGLLIVGDAPEAAKTLSEWIPAGLGSVTEIYLQLDATGVPADAANLSVPWDYTLTYTLVDQ